MITEARLRVLARQRRLRVDLLVISSNRKAIYDRAFEAAFQADLEHGTLTTLVFYTPEEFSANLSRGEPLLKEVVRGGRVVDGARQFPRYERAHLPIGL